jgi:Flp pilus assembly protein TadD
LNSAVEGRGVNDIFESEPSKNILDAGMLRFESNGVVLFYEDHVRGQPMRTLLILFAVLCAFPAFADYDKALELFNQKKYQESLKVVADSLEVSKDSDPASPNFKLRFLAAQNHRKLGNLQNAILHLQRCSNINPKSADPYIDLAYVSIDMGKYKDALAYAQKAQQLDPKNATAYYLSGMAQYKMGVFWSAKEFFEKANSLDQEMYIAWNALGLTLMQLKKFADANTAFSTALAWSPDTPEILNNLSVSAARMGRIDEAVKYITRAAELAPQNEQIKKNREMISKAKQ